MTVPTVTVLVNALSKRPRVSWNELRAICDRVEKAVPGLACDIATDNVDFCCNCVYHFMFKTETTPWGELVVCRLREITDLDRERHNEHVPLCVRGDVVALLSRL